MRATGPAILCSAFLLVACILLPAGCGQDEHVRLLEEKNAAIGKENRLLKNEMEDVRIENARLENQVKSLALLSDDVRMEGLYKLESVKLTKYTNFYDRDNDGRREKLIVYIQPIDSQGDIIKASGSVQVELWDLNADSDRALLAQWRVAPDELKKMWFGTIITANYRLIFDITEVVEPAAVGRPYTVKMTFTDYVSGRVFDAQHVIKVARHLF